MIASESPPTKPVLIVLDMAKGYSVRRRFEPDIAADDDFGRNVRLE